LNPVISSIEKLLFEGNRRIKKKREKAILIMGSTGSGKSTLAAYFGQYKLESKFDSEKGEIKIKGLGIAEGYGSETKIPNEIQGMFKGEKISIFDCPGFFDTEGLE
jgi:predicted GTPase